MIAQTNKQTDSPTLYVKIKYATLVSHIVRS